jgi:phospholipid transport system substrate-binding protein
MQWILIALVAVSIAAPAAADPPAAAADTTAQSTPSSTAATRRIDDLHVQLLDVMKNAVALGYSGREQKLGTVIPEYYDVAFMAEKSLGPSWNSLDGAGRTRYLETFQRFMVANYAGRFDGWSGQSFETLGEEPAPRDTAVVKSRLVDPQAQNVTLNYRMHEVDGKWKVIDVFLDGTVSELALRRSEFVSIVKRDGIDALIKALDDKIAKLAAGGQA